MDKTYSKQNTHDKIQSIRETLAGGYKKPDPHLVDVFIESMRGHPQALEYLHGRGLSEETIKYFKLGYDKDKNAITIPVYKKGELVNIRYRYLNPESRMKYSQEKGCEVWLYHDEGISIGLEKGGVLIVEGEFDLMSAWQAGFKNVISPASGKDSYGPWIELIDPIKKVYIAYDNDKPGKAAGYDLAGRIGIDKSFEVCYGEGFKDANEYFLKHDAKDFKELLKKGKPYYKYKFQGVGDIIESMMNERDDLLSLDTIPFVKFEEDWVAVISGDSNIGKTTYVMNVAEELTRKDIPTLVLPFERGVKSVGQRFIQIKYEKQKEDFSLLDPSDWEKMKDECVDMPLYFSMPKVSEIEDTIARSKRLFNIKFVIVDHLDYFISGNDKVAKQADMMMQFKTMAQEHSVIFLVVHHISKPKSKKRRRPTKEDLKGASDIYQIAEVVALLHQPDTGEVEVIIDKNKGPMGFRIFKADMSTGKFHPMNEETVAVATPYADDDDDWGGF